MKCNWCRKRIWWFQFRAGFLSSFPDTLPPVHLSCQAEREKFPAIAERQDERVG